MGLYVGSSKVSASSGSIDVVALSNITNAAIEATNNANAAADAANAAAEIAIGSTDVDNAELYDIRTGYDGTVYDSAGDAVRGQAEQIVASVKKATANYLRGEESGALVHVEDAWPSPVRGMKVYGKSEQVQTTGKNLYSSELYPLTAERYINNTTGNLTTWGSGWSATLDYIPVKPNATYTLSGIGTITTVVESGIAVYDADKAYLAGTNGNTITTPDNAAYMRFTAITGNTNIQLELGSTATSYEPYTGGKPSPSPEYPQEIKSIAEASVKACGKNLYIPRSTSIINQGVRYTPDATGATCGTINGTAVGIMWLILGPTEKCLIPGEKYTLRANKEIQAQLWSNVSKTSIAHKKEGSEKITFTTYDKTLTLAITNETGASFSNFPLYIQIEPGTEATPYSPYTGSTTTVSLTAEDGTVYELRSLPDGTRDEVGIVDGRWVLTKRVGELVLDGVTEYKKVTGADNGNRRWIVNLAPHMEAQAIDGYSLSAISDVFIADGGHNTWVEKNNFSVSCATYDRALGIVFVLDSSVTTVEGANAWLAEHTPTVHYRLATSVTIDLGPADTPLLPETVSNVWAVSEPSTEVGVTYERDVTVAYNNLCAAIVAAGATE